MVAPVEHEVGDAAVALLGEEEVAVGLETSRAKEMRTDKVKDRISLTSLSSVAINRDIMRLNVLINKDLSYKKQLKTKQRRHKRLMN